MQQAKERKAYEIDAYSDAKFVIHGCSEHGEPGTGKSSNKRVRCNSRIGVPQVNVNKVIQTLQEDHEDSPSDENARDSLRNPSDVRTTRPRKPKKSNWEDNGTKDHRD